jgi:hypothetical protein
MQTSGKLPKKRAFISASNRCREYGYPATVLLFLNRFQILEGAIARFLCKRETCHSAKYVDIRLSLPR